MPTARPDRVRLVVLVHRQEGMSLEDFHAYWRDEHAKIFTSVAIFKKNILNYEQAHANVDALKMMKEAGATNIEADGIAIFEAASYEKIFEVFADDDYKKIVIPDEERFLDRSKFTALPCDMAPVYDDPS